MMFSAGSLDLTSLFAYSYKMVLMRLLYCVQERWTAWMGQMR